MAFTYGRGAHTDSYLINITILLGVVVLIKKEKCQWNDKYDLNHERKLCKDALGDHCMQIFDWILANAVRRRLMVPVTSGQMAWCLGWANNLVHIFISLHFWVKCTNIAYLCFCLLLIITFDCFTGMSVHKLSVSVMYKWCSCRWV